MTAGPSRRAPIASSGPPRWAVALLARLAPPWRGEEVLGDLEEVHRARVARRGRVVASLLTGLEALDMAAALLRERWRFPTASALDFKLGFRMMARYPSLTAVAVLAMAFGIAGGAAGFQWVKEATFLPPLPYRDEARIVRIQHVDTRTTAVEPRALHHFDAWRESLASVEHLSALSLRERSLGFALEPGAPVAEGAVSASAFDLLRVPPLLGRRLLPADEAPGAPAVAVIGWDLWQRRFGGTPDVVGRVVRLDGAPTTVVGVMPEDFAFFTPRKGITMPAPQDLWVPFRARARDHAPGAGPAIVVFGRLTREGTPERLRAELATLAARSPVERADTLGRLEPEVLTFGGPLGVEGLIPSGVLTMSALFLAALMAVVCGNVALLLFARAATREAEIALRSALGASRGRIVAQLFAEALAIAAVAVVVGLAGAQAGLRWGIGVLERMLHAEGQTLPSWIDAALSPATIGYAALLALVGAVVAGVLPGLTVTGRRTQPTLQRLVGRGAGVRLGGVWTAIVIAQVTLTVMFVPVAVVFGIQTWKVRSVDLGLPAGEHLAVRLEMEGGAEAAMDAASRARFEEGWRALRHRLTSEPGVTGVTVADALPGGLHAGRRFELDPSLRSGPLRSGPAPADTSNGSGRWAQVASVDPDFFEVMRSRLVAGRGFGDADGEAAVLVVNESFVREHLGGRNAVGQRVRFRDPSAPDGAGPWHTVVGVVRDLAMTVDPTVPVRAGIYRPLGPRAAYPVRMAVRLAGPYAGRADAFAGRLHELAAEAAPALRLLRPLPLEQSARGLLIAYDATFRIIALAGALAILLTNAGIYAVISFTVARRTREIGVRVALGADPRRVVSAILARTARHVGVGVVVGTALGAALAAGASEGTLRPTALQAAGLLLAYMALMMTVCLTACVAPTRRALRIQPTEALGTE